MNTAISIQDDLFDRADRFATRAGKSRSQIYQEAIAEYLDRRDPARVTSAMNAALDAIDQTADPWADAVVRHGFEGSQW